MKQFVSEIGGRERALRYTFADARALKRRFGPLPKLIEQDDALGMFNITNMDPDFQVAFVAAGLNHDLKLPAEEVEERVASWFGELASAGGPGIGPVVFAAFKAALYSGIVHGKSIDFDGEFKKASDKRKVFEVADPGKDAAAAEASPPEA